MLVHRSLLATVLCAASAPSTVRAQSPALPAADEASGIVVPAEREDHTTENTLLAVPRAIARVIFAAPRYAAIGLDYYLESRSPNAFARDVRQRWRFGVVADYEPRFHTSYGARLGYEVTRHLVVDGTVGFFGVRGRSGGARVAFGTFDAGIPLAPSLEASYATLVPRLYTGIGEGRAAKVDVEEQRTSAAAQLLTKLGAVELSVRTTFASALAEDEDAGEADAAMDIPVGLGARDRSLTGELVATWDQRETRYPWIPKAAPAAGTLVRGSLGYTRGDIDPWGRYGFGRASLEVRHLIDIFHGDRVLSLGARTEALTAEAMSVPFMHLPALGGPTALRALVRDELRDRVASYADVEYAWPLGNGSRGYLFVETGEVHADYAAFDPQALHIGYGGGIRVFENTTTWLRLQIAGADGDEVGVFAQVGAL